MKKLLCCLTALMTIALIGCSEAKAEDFSYSIEDNMVTIKGYLGSDSKVNIPETIEGSKVVAIEEYAFENNVVKAIKVPNTVTEIDENAFDNCTMLEELYLPDNITEMPDLDGCDSLKEIEIPDELFQELKSNDFNGLRRSEEYELKINGEKVTVPERLTAGGMMFSIVN